jgi:outer membrane protein assembly factor BamA
MNRALVCAGTRWQVAPWQGAANLDRNLIVVRTGLARRRRLICSTATSSIRMAPMIAKDLCNRTLAVLTMLLLVSLIVGAQSSGQHNLSAIHFTGLHRYAPEQVIAASGLRIGAPIAAAGLQSAAERLSKTGAFDSVSFQFSTLGNDLTAQFGVTETRDVLPCIFDNFVWFTDADLELAIRKNVPLYTGVAPVRGDTVPRIISTLQDFLRANGISGEVSEIPSGSIGTVSSLVFRVDGISQPIKRIAFSGEAAVSDQQLSAASATLANQDFSVTNVAAYASAALIPLYYQRGYLRSQFERPRVTLIEANSKGPLTPVALTLPVVEGNQYFWKGALWSGNQALSADELAKSLAMNQPEVANQEKIDAGFVNVRKAYLSRGYINVRITPVRNLDDVVKLASYSVQVDEGAQFRMGQVYFDGVPDRAAAALLKKWKLKPGDIYDANYPVEFLQKTAPQEVVQAGSSYHNSTMKPELDSTKLVVNLHIQFR